LNRTVKVLILGISALGFVAVMCGGILLIVSGGKPVDYIQTALIRLSLAGRQEDLARSAGIDNTPVRFTVESGDTPRRIAQNLFGLNLINDPDLFVDYVRVNDLDIQLEAGVYFLDQTQTIPQIALALTDSASSTILFTIIEGLRIEEVAALIDRNPRFGFTGADFLAVVGQGAIIQPDFMDFANLPSGASLEGFLFPDTYQLPAAVTPELLRTTLLQTFIDRVLAEDLLSTAIAQGWTLYDAVTIASIIQREAVHTDEHTMISSVYRNRLDIGMKLDADPTVQYAIGFNGATWWSPLTIADYSNIVSPYNTYLNTGLPPSPIANPGISAIRAAIQPAQSDFLYFRARCNGDGYHNFARTFEEHLANGC
jgi:UPF0755 protein